jgi:DNA invertase Pin-like site-specific DNA recombinase
MCPTNQIVMKKNKEVKAAIYARASNDTVGDASLCIECQIAECQDYCDRQSLTVVAGHFDIGSASATSRPGLDAVYDLLLTGLVDALVVTSLSRIFRTRKKAIEFAELLSESGVTLYVCDLEQGETREICEVIPAKMSANDSKSRSQRGKNKSKVIPKQSKKK